MMSLLFHHRQTYDVHRPVEQVQTRLKQIVTRRWEDYSMDLVGRLNEEGNFTLRSKWPLVNVEWIYNNPGAIEGMLIKSSGGTQIKTVTTPNKLLVGFFYGTLALLVLEISGLETIIPIAQKIKVAMLVTLNVIVFTLTILFRNGVKRRFEELMGLA
jgi:hypothetical protein